jgi:hypothetical protein
MDNTAQFQQLLAALQQGLQPLQPAPQAPVTFAKSPGQANLDQLIDYSTTARQKQWQEVTAPLLIKFKVEDKQVNQFNEILMHGTSGKARMGNRKQQHTYHQCQWK